MSETIITSEKPSNPSMLNPSSRTICHVCQKQFSQYTCPRCNSRYCSLPCYKSHSVRCTESFMKENVMDELRQVQSDDETKRKMLEMLKRYHEEEEEEDMMYEEDSTLSEEIIQKALSGDGISFDDLSLEEKRKFERAVAAGELSKMIEPWDPWWVKPSAQAIRLSKQGTRLVQPLSQDESSNEAALSTEIPPGPDTPLLPLSKLSSTNPSPLLSVHLVDIVYSYCFTLRIYNGDWQSDATGAAMTITSISSVLGGFGQPETVMEALSYCLGQTCSPAFRHMGGLKFGLSLIDDVFCLLSLGSEALICMLCDLQRMIQAAISKVKTVRTRRSLEGEMKKKLKLGERKVYFLMCWVHEQPLETWTVLSSKVKEEKSSVIQFGSGGALSRKEREDRKNAGGVLIEEME